MPIDLSITGLDPKMGVARIEALADCDLGDYILSDTTKHPDGTVSNLHVHTYRFVNRYLPKGSTVYLHNGEGDDAEQWLNADGDDYEVSLGIEEKLTQEMLDELDGILLTKEVHLFWGVKADIFNDTGEELTLYKIEDEESFTFEEE